MFGLALSLAKSLCATVILSKTTLWSFNRITTWLWSRQSQTLFQTSTKSNKGRVSFLTIAILLILCLIEKTKMVDRITEVNGAAAEIQNNFGLFKLYHNLKPYVRIFHILRSRWNWNICIFYYANCKMKNLTMCLVINRKARKLNPSKMVCHDHCNKKKC